MTRRPLGECPQLGEKLPATTLSIHISLNDELMGERVEPGAPIPEVER